MGRYARQAIANIPYHIINRGNNRQVIFFGDDDYRFFLDALKAAKEKYPCKIYSFILMTNHIHLLLEAVEESRNLAYFIKHITQRYTQYINKYYKRSGALWEGRFKSSTISTDRYLLACSRYIEMNCVRAGIVNAPEDYHLSSYRTKIGLDDLEWLDYDPVYLGLGKTGKERQVEYQKWLHQSIPEDEWNLIRNAVQKSWAYGSDRFKEEIEGILGRRFEIKRAEIKLCEI